MQSEMDMFYGKSNLIWSVMGISKYHRIHTTAGYFQWDPLARHGLHWLSLTMADRVKGRQNASYPGEVSHMSSCFTPLKHGLNYRPVGYPRSSQSWRRSCFVGGRIEDVPHTLHYTSTPLAISKAFTDGINTQHKHFMQAIRTKVLKPSHSVFCAQPQSSLVHSVSFDQ